jgi:Protein of unknown function (DUF1236)
MNRNFCYGLAALIVTASTGVAAAAGVTGSATSDHLNLTSAQRHEIWQTVSKQAAKENAPTGFKAMVGETAPGSIKLQALPSDVSSRIPAMKWYDFAMLQNQVLIVDPSSKKIVDIVTQ